MTPLVLGALAVALAGPVPALLARAHRLRRTPYAALVLWQAVALAAVLAALGATLALVTIHLLPADERVPHLMEYAVAAVALTITGLVAGRLLLSGHRVGADLRRIRRRHADQVDLLGRAREGGVRVLEGDTPVAYCLPGLHRGRVVVSAGVIERLAETEVDAVLAHEWAHLRFRHDLVVEFFDVLHRAFPRWVSSARALAEVRLLVEMCADATAVRAAGRRPLAQALVQLAEARTPAAALGAGTGSRSDLLARMERLAEPSVPRGQGPAVVAVAVAVLVLPTWLIVAPWLEAVAGLVW
ncbi:M56 family metallopeptidase [Nocardioides zeae]|uniref:M56 family metallopeptidase n=1 Tax=Nocardioides imazamoxiresistens TaxID=3231893 RepID=A0ABU3PTS7_9ACTN|nr:M56 family metallopeptidase [Nocardioides zeae]MDT9592589.1 M56 family metallopeptidase [Nocardioides zeae]